MGGRFALLAGNLAGALQDSGLDDPSVLIEYPREKADYSGEDAGYGHCEAYWLFSMRLDESFGFRIELVLRSVACVHFERYRIYTLLVLARRRPTTFLTVTASLVGAKRSLVCLNIFSTASLW